VGAEARGQAERVANRRSTGPATLACLSLVTLCALSLSCGGSSPAPAEYPYLHDASYRRGELEASLVNAQNAYSALRLAHYATGSASDWDALPEWNPPTEMVAASELDAATGAATTALNGAGATLAIPDESALADEAALIALGKTAFERFPAQIAPYLAVALASRATAESYGLWTDDARGVGGVVRVRMADGSVNVALTCSSCHAASGAGGIENGLSNAALDLGAAMVDGASVSFDTASASRFRAWGAGRLDVTTTAGTEPVRIADLRPVRFQSNLQQDATVRMRGETALAIRIETLLITSSGQVLRPPRAVPLALAAYLLSLGAALPDPGLAQAASARGAALFSARCGACHAPPRFSGPAVALATIGTDPTLGLSADRGTGTYRVPSLRGVGTRGPLLHDGTLPSLDAMFDPTRTSESFAGALHGKSAVPGHLFGLDLSDADRAALIAYLRAL
jgi:mono/diheme cytochrome c family protein